MTAGTREEPAAVRALSAFLGQRHTVGRGRVAQSAAERYLQRAGYRVVGRNWRCKAGEIDVVAFDGPTLCFIEVKARSSRRYGPAIAAVDRRKQRRIANAASWLLSRSGHRGPCRFDVLGMDRDGDTWRFTLVRAAFEVE